MTHFVTRHGVRTQYNFTRCLMLWHSSGKESQHLTSKFVFIQFESAYLFQIPREKLFDYVKVICMKKYEIAHHLTNREALIVLCSVVKHAGSG